MQQNDSLGSNGVDRVCSSQKSPMQLRGTNFCTSLACFAPSFVRQPNGPKCTQMVWNAPNNRLGSNGVDRVRSSWKTPTRPRRTNFCTYSECFAPSFVRQPNGPKCTQMVWNTPKHEFVSNGVDRVHSLQKILMRLHGMNFYISYTNSARSAPSFV